MAIFDLSNEDNIQDGTSFADIIKGNGGNDILRGLGGDDDIFGGLGNDELRGGAGNDFLSGGAGADLLIGGIGNDTLFGGGGRDVLSGGDGFDFLNGNAGNARLTGGAGGDNFQFDLGVGRVFVTDFQNDVDTLLIDGDFFPGKTIQQILTQHGSSSGGDSAIDLSGTGADAPRIILIGVANVFDLANDIVLI